MDYHFRILASWSIRRKLSLLFLIIFMPAFGIIVKSGLSYHADVIEKAKSSALLLVQNMAVQQEQIATSTKVMLSTLAQSQAVRNLDSEACNVLFREMNIRYPFYSVILEATPDGNVFAASMPFERGSINLADRKHIRDAISTLDFSAGDFIRGRLSNTLSISIAYPVFDENWNLVAVISAAVNLDEYARFVSKVNLPEDWSITITDYKGFRLYRFPVKDETAPGEPIPDVAFKLASGDSDEGSFETYTQDGIEKVYAFKQLRLHKDSPPYMYALVGFGKNQISDKADMQMLWNLSVLGIAAFVALFAAWVFGNFAFLSPIKHLVTAAKRFGDGEMSARTCLTHTPDELGLLAQSFDEMA